MIFNFDNMSTIILSKSIIKYTKYSEAPRLFLYRKNHLIPYGKVLNISQKSDDGPTAKQANML